MLIALEKLFVFVLVTLCFFTLGFWLWPSATIFSSPVGELTLGTILWGALSVCVWIGCLRFVGYELEKLNKHLSAPKNAEEKVIIDCPYCEYKMRIPLGRRLQVKCPNPVCAKDFKHGDAETKTLVEYSVLFIKIMFMVFMICVFVSAFFTVWEKGCCQIHLPDSFLTWR